MSDGSFRIEELKGREVFVKKTRVGVIVGERFHPNENRVRSLRIRVDSGVADEFMRKPAEYAPLSKELLHSIQSDDTVKLSKSMRELQRRWRNTIRIDEKLYAPDELIDRAVLDTQSEDLGVVVGLVKMKRTYRGVTVKVRDMVRRRFRLDGDTIHIPVQFLSRTTQMLDEIILSRTFDKLRALPSYIKLNSGDLDDLVLEEE